MQSSLTGVYYAAPAPTAAPLINVGDTITIGQAIALIQAMKVFSEIPSVSELPHALLRRTCEVTVKGTCVCSQQDVLGEARTLVPVGKFVDLYWYWHREKGQP